MHPYIAGEYELLEIGMGNASKAIKRFFFLLKSTEIKVNEKHPHFAGKGVNC